MSGSIAAKIGHMSGMANVSALACPRSRARSPARATLIIGSIRVGGPTMFMSGSRGTKARPRPPKDGYRCSRRKGFGPRSRRRSRRIRSRHRESSRWTSCTPGASAGLSRAKTNSALAVFSFRPRRPGRVFPFAPPFRGCPGCVDRPGPGNTYKLPAGGLSEAARLGRHRKPPLGLRQGSARPSQGGAAALKFPGGPEGHRKASHWRQRSRPLWSGPDRIKRHGTRPGAGKRSEARGRASIGVTSRNWSVQVLSERETTARNPG